MVLILSSFSPLGTALYETIKKNRRAALHNLDLPQYLEEGKIQDIIKKNKPSVCINCIEYSFLDDAEYNREFAYNINGFAAGRVAGICNENNIFCIYMSSSYVFDGSENNPYNEDYPPLPNTVFGDSKFLGEKLTGEKCENNCIIRLSDYYSSPGDILSFPCFKVDEENHVLYSLKNGLISPASINDCAEAVYELVSRDAAGTFHFNPADPSSPREVAEFLADNRGEPVSDGLEIIELDSREFLTPAARNVTNALDISKYISFTGRPVQGWRDALQKKK